MIVISEGNVYNKFQGEKYSITRGADYYRIKNNGNNAKIIVSEENNTIISNLDDIEIKNIFPIKVAIAVSLEEGLDEVVIDVESQYSEQVRDMLENENLEILTEQKDKESTAFYTILEDYEKSIPIKEVVDDEKTLDDNLDCSSCGSGVIEERHDSLNPEFGFEYYACTNCDKKYSDIGNVPAIFEVEDIHNRN